MTEPTEKPNDPPKPQSLADNVQNLFESLKRTEISLPQAIVIAATLIMLGLIFS